MRSMSTTSEPSHLPHCGPGLPDAPSSADLGEPTLTIDELFAALGRSIARNDALTRMMGRCAAERDSAIAQRDEAQAALEAITARGGG